MTTGSPCQVMPQRDDAHDAVTLSRQPKYGTGSDSSSSDSSVSTSQSHIQAAAAQVMIQRKMIVQTWKLTVKKNAPLRSLGNPYPGPSAITTCMGNYPKKEW
mmetsp:Transcript_47058/g.84266  ORF Transcript_47058/g.84266 Transcript_47058/m.84266 type:complete len:102 (-) Transcript_47058:611-916(-)